MKKHNDIYGDLDELNLDEIIFHQQRVKLTTMNLVISIMGTNIDYRFLYQFWKLFPLVQFISNWLNIPYCRVLGRVP